VTKIVYLPVGDAARGGGRTFPPGHLPAARPAPPAGPPGAAGPGGPGDSSG